MNLACTLGKPSLSQSNMKTPNSLDTSMLEESNTIYTVKNLVIFAFLLVYLFSGMFLVVLLGFSLDFMYLSVIIPFFILWIFIFRNQKDSKAQFIAVNHLKILTAQERGLIEMPESLRLWNAKVSQAFETSLFDRPVVIFTTHFQRMFKDHEDAPLWFMVVQIKLEKEFPHFFLDGHLNSLTAPYAAANELQLEGDLHKHFTLYSPKGGQIGVLAVLTPDVMATLIDVAKPLDIELKGNTLSLIIEGGEFTQVRVKTLEKALSALIQEFDHLVYTWKPEYRHDGMMHSLHESPMRVFTRKVMIFFLGLLAFIYFGYLGFLILNFIVRSLLDAIG